MSTAFRDHVLRECIEALKRHGFVEFRKGYVTRNINNEFSCWIGLVCGSFSDRMIYPQIGVHAHTLDRIVNKLRNSSNSKYDRRNASYSMPLLMLAPSEPYFVFATANETPMIADRLARFYDRVGYPFSQSISTNEALLPLLREFVPTFGGYPERYAVCLYELGRREEAIAFVTELEEEAEHLKPFCVNFLEFCRKTAS